MFIAALFTIAKTWKQPKCPSTVEWIKKMLYNIYIYNGILLSHKKERNNAGEGVEKREHLYTVGGNEDWYSHYRKQKWRFLKKLKIELPYPAILLLGIYAKEI